jgi:hypothetical protein
MVISSNRVWTRKEHSCWACGLKLPKGSDMHSTVWVDGGDITRSYWCLPCNAFLNENNQDFEEGVSFGQFAGEPVYEEFKQKYYEKN